MGTTFPPRLGDRGKGNEMSDFSKMVVATIDGRPVTQGELSTAFDWVADRSNWKNPIDCVVVLSFRQMALVREAVPFFTGGPVVITPAQGTMSATEYTRSDSRAVRVEADGYYRCVGA
jgi:hypothetical protein